MVESTAARASGPDPAPGDVAASARQPHPSLAGAAPPHRRRAVVVVALAVLGALIALTVFLGFATILGTGALWAGAVLALVPLGIVLLGIRWIDQWEPEPAGLALLALLWGAGVSALAALEVDAQVAAVLASAGLSAESADVVAAVVQAPLVEELAKGLGLLLLYWFARAWFDGPVDGVVYAAWVAAGFAFTENALYFGREFAAAAEGSVGELFVIRGVLSPFAHVMFTACIGVALGLAARRRGSLATVGIVTIGFALAVGLHAFWNAALLVVTDFFGYYAIVQVPLFLVAIGLVAGLRRAESRLTRERLAEYAAAGWFNPDELDALATPAGRRSARAWASAHGCGAQLRDYVRLATRLAFARQRILSPTTRRHAQHDESVLLSAVVAARARLVAAAPPPPS